MKPERHHHELKTSEDVTNKEPYWNRKHSHIATKRNENKIWKKTWSESTMWTETFLLLPASRITQNPKCIAIQKKIAQNKTIERQILKSVAKFRPGLDHVVEGIAWWYAWVEISLRVDDIVGFEHSSCNSIRKKFEEGVNVGLLWRSASEVANECNTNRIVVRSSIADCVLASYFPAAALKN